MIELPKEKYYLLKEPLKKIEFNTLFARFIVEGIITGRVFVNNCENPTVYYVLHPYGMSLLYGDSKDENFNTQLVKYILNSDGVRQSTEWMQVYPLSWAAKLKELLGKNLIADGECKVTEKTTELNSRINFKFNVDNYLQFSKTLTAKYEIVQTDESIFNELKGRVVPQNFWNNSSEFFSNGIGFTLLNDGMPASTAFSAFILENKLELGMETFGENKGRGLAQYVCSKLIDYCLKNGYEPIWSCRFENTPSYKLAIKLGFLPTLSLPYYKLNI